MQGGNHTFRLDSDCRALFTIEALAVAEILAGNAAQQVRDQNTDGNNSIPASAPLAVGSGGALYLGVPAPLNESFEDWGIAPDLSLGRHLCADDFATSLHTPRHNPEGE